MKEWLILQKILKDCYHQVQEKFTPKDLMFLYRIIVYENQPEVKAKKEIMALGGYTAEEVRQVCKKLKENQVYSTEMGIIRFKKPNPFRDSFKEKLKKELESEEFTNAQN